jgi:hypothetical protein
MSRALNHAELVSCTDVIIYRLDEFEFGLGSFSLVQVRGADVVYDNQCQAKPPTYVVTAFGK